MNLPLMIVTKGEAVLRLIEMQEEFKSRGCKILISDTYSFTVREQDHVTEVSWTGVFIEANLNID